MGSQKTHKTVMKSLRWTVTWVLLIVLPSAYAIYNIFQPEQFPIRFFRGEVTQVANTLLLGPYPTEQEIKRLKRLGVTEVISLLDPSMPFEAPLIDKEKQLMEKYHLAFQSVPLYYLPNLNSQENLARVEKLVEYLRNNARKRYVHCYLGRHRTTLLKKLYLQAISDDGP